MKRRTFIYSVTGAAGFLAALAALVPAAGFFFGPFFESKPQTWQPVGALDDFKEGTTTLVSFTDASPEPWAGVVAKTAAWLRRKPDGEFVAFSVNCTHLGCPIRWEADAKLFLCPCHGGVYNQDGDVVGGPPPRALTQYEVRVNKNGVEILTADLPIT